MESAGADRVLDGDRRIGVGRRLGPWRWAVETITDLVRKSWGSRPVLGSRRWT
jgi:hypothetical protein